MMLKKILRTAAGALVSLFALLMLVSFIGYCATPRAPFARDPMNAMGYALWWLVILGAGTGGFFLSRGAWRAWRDGGGATKLKGDYDDDDAG